MTICYRQSNDHDQLDNLSGKKLIHEIRSMAILANKGAQQNIPLPFLSALENNYLKRCKLHEI